MGTRSVCGAPLLGPSTLRDAMALPLDMNGNPLRQVRPVSDRNSLYACAWWITRELAARRVW